MADIRIEGLHRRFGAVEAVDDVSLHIRHGELFTLLGPSGCGKTTLLRMVAGFTDPDQGSIHVGDRRIDRLPPHRRDTGMVFQNYAIFPNLTVAGNVAYGLKARRVPPPEIARRVAAALGLVVLDDHGERWPHQLSGGQLQRVALARALVIEPEVLLLDEPLSNLDARLRVEMRGEIRRLQQSLGITAIYVTHDQEEALAISDRVAVMRAGRLEQVGTPTEIYHRPATPFAAQFVGTVNLLQGTVVAREGARVRLRIEDQLLLVPAMVAPGSGLSIALRPENLRLLTPDAPCPEGWGSLSARIERVEFLGPLTRLEIAAGRLTLHVATTETVDMVRQGDAVTLAYDPARITVFAPP
ncbi:MAG: ABC transporter ATP-binding protein [Alphaproteobacteria bacterium]|nr:ABC transporter ATP-binding protein [Alphaproteobacteria bacterium]